MEYLQRLMARQALLAAVFEQQQTLRYAEYSVTAPVGKAAERPSELPEEERQTPEDAPGAALYRSLTRLQSAQEQTAAIRRLLEQEQAAQPLVSQTPLTRQTSGQTQEGGVVCRSWQTMRTSGLAGMQTRRSMEEISRFFERDSRRY